jgi:flavorubredoxin
MEAFPDAVIVSSAKAFAMMKNFFEGEEFADRRIVVKEGDTLELGAHVLSFVGAPMVHWPEVLMTYDSKDKVLFSADAFGKFGAHDAAADDDDDEDNDWVCEARRYYFGIVGKYGIQVQAVLKKAAKLDIQTICPLHGPVLNENLGYYLDIYNTWSSYGSETKGVVINYTSVYGHTKKAVELLAEKLREKGVPKVAVNDLARSDIAECVEDAFRYDTVVFATTTFNNDIFPFMKEFIHHLTERSFQNKRVAFVENGSWAPTAAKTMKTMLEGCKNLEYAENGVRIVSALNDQSRDQIEALAEELAASYK